MNYNITRFLIIFSVFLFISSCAHTPRYSMQELPSGRTIKIAGVGKIYFTQSDPALMLKYYTETKIDDMVSLQREVDDIWPVFKINAEESGLNAAIISANEMPDGFISKTISYNFLFEKQLDGSWVQIKK